MREAARHFALVDADPQADDTIKKMNAAIIASAQGDWDSAVKKLQELIREDANNFVVGTHSVCTRIGLLGSNY